MRVETIIGTGTSISTSVGGPFGTRRFFACSRVLCILFLVLGLFVNLSSAAAQTSSQSSESRDADSFLSGIAGDLDRRGYSEGETEMIIGEIKGAGEYDIPARILIPRVQEGAAKGVAATRIRAALERDIAYLRQARRLFRETGGGEVFLEREGQWLRAANMLSADFNRDELRSILEVCSARPETFRPISQLYVSLEEWGLSSSLILDLAEALVSSPLPPRQYNGITDLYRLARSRRVSPDELSARIRTEAEKVTSLEELRRRVLRD